MLVRLTTSDIAAHFGSIIFIINPAGIFFNSCYSESIYFCFFISGFYFLISEKPRPFITSLLFMVASSIRSNGIVNAAFLGHFYVHSIAQAWYADLGIHTSTLGQNEIKNAKSDI